MPAFSPPFWNSGYDVKKNNIMINSPPFLNPYDACTSLRKQCLPSPKVVIFQDRGRSSEHLNERLDAMRSAIFDTSLSNRLVDLPRNSASRLIRFNGSAQAIRDALASGQSLEIGKDLLQTVGCRRQYRSQIKENDLNQRCVTRTSRACQPAAPDRAWHRRLDRRHDETAAIRSVASLANPRDHRR